MNTIEDAANVIEGPPGTGFLSTKSRNLLHVILEMTVEGKPE